MLGVDETLKRILDAFSPLSAVTLPLLEAVGLVLAEDVIATVDVPPFRNSAMDGYAVRSEDTTPAPRTLKVTSTVKAGSTPSADIASGQAARIMTGAPLPAGADCVVRFEETDESSRAAGSAEISVARQVQSWENVREAGEDITAGDVALTAGTRLRPAEIGVMAAVNQSVATVHRRPRVGILSTGDEVTAPGDVLRDGAIRDANSYIVAASVSRLGAIPVMLGIARDNLADVRDRLGSLDNLDILVTSGGVSVGDYDMVKDVLQASGTMDIWQVRMKPGKPLAFGHIGDIPLLGLPGNPVAALVSFEQFGRPAMLKMMGRADVYIPTVQAEVREHLENRGRRRHFVRGILTREAGGPVFQSAGMYGSAILRSVVQSNCLLVIPEDVAAIEPGDTATVQLLDEGL